MSDVKPKRGVSSVIAIDIARRRRTENRAHDRHLKILRVAKFIYNEREGLGVVRNLSDGGMKIDAYTTMAVGQPVSVSLSDGQHLDATVVWQHDQTIGIKFDTLASVDQLLAIPVKSEGGKVARPPRVTTQHPALLRSVKLGPLNVEVCDLSQRGAKILSSAQLAANEDVSLELPGLPPLAATIRWAGAGLAGLAFHEVLAVKALMEWLSTTTVKSSQRAT